MAKQRRIPEATRAELDKIVKQVVTAYQPEKIILFGSYELIERLKKFAK